MWWYGGPGWGWGAALVLGTGVLLLVVAVVVWLLLQTRRTGGDQWSPAGGRQEGRRRTPLDVLDERLARGEVDLEEYQRRRDLLARHHEE